MRITPLCIALFLLGCEADDPKPSVDASRFPDAGPKDAAEDASCMDRGTFPASDESGCQALATDYAPRSGERDTGTWPSCVSDENAYVPFGQSISTVARVAAFESIAEALFGDQDPSAQAFLDARLIYVKDNGLDSRVARREDEHYPPAAKACRDLSADELAASRDRCVGPAQIQPLLNQAFEGGAQGKSPAENAARIEAGVLWFLYVSAHKEATTCTTTAADCDSAYAYYTGDEARGSGKGLARYVRAQSANTHDRIWDGILAVRCWRDLDHPTATATDTALRDRAILQMDRALLRGVALLVRERANRMATGSCASADADWAFLQVLGPVLVREATVRNPTFAKTLEGELAKNRHEDVNAMTLVSTLDALFDCP